VRFRDTDALGHVNNAVYLTYLEIERTHYWKHLFNITDLRKAGFIIAHASIWYRSPAYQGETLLVSGRISRLGTKSFDFEYEIREASSNRLVAEALTTQVMYDYEVQKSIAIPYDIRKTILAFEGEENVRQTNMSHAPKDG